MFLFVKIDLTMLIIQQAPRYSNGQIPSNCGVVVRGAGGPGAGGNQVGGVTIRIGGRVPWGAEVEYANRAGYVSRGRVSVTHVVDERSYAVMLARPEQVGAGPGEDRTEV